MNILGIVGSYRKSGNTDILVNKVLQGAREHGIDTQVIYLADYNIKDCIGCEGCKPSCRCLLHDDMDCIYAMLEQADGIVLGSPTYFYNVTGIVKIFLDRLYCYEVFDQTDRSVWMGMFEVTGIKYGVTVAVCEQQHEDDMGYTSPAMSRTLEAVGIRVVDNVKALHVFAKGEILEHEDFLDRSVVAGKKLAKTLLLHQETKATLAGR